MESDTNVDVLARAACKELFMELVHGSLQNLEFKTYGSAVFLWGDSFWDSVDEGTCARSRIRCRLQPCTFHPLLTHTFMLVRDHEPFSKYNTTIQKYHL